MMGRHTTTAALAFLILLDASAIGCGESIGASAPRTEGTEHSALQEALRLSCDAQFDEAVELFSSVGTGPDRSAAAAALHSLGSLAAVRGEVLLSGMYHGAAKARDPKTVPPLAAMHLGGEECNGIGDIFWTSSFAKKTVYETFFAAEDGGGKTSVPFDGLAEGDFATYVELAEEDSDETRRDKLFEVHVGLATQLEDSGFVECSAFHFARASELKPNHVGLKVRNALSIPVVYESTEHVRDAREALARNVSRLVASARVGNVTIDSLDHLSMPGTYYVVYGGYNDAEIMSRIAELYGLSYPSLNRVTTSLARAVADDRIKVGFASHYFRAHSVCKLLCGMIRNLDRTEFRVTLFSSTETEDEWTDYVAERADDFVRVPEGFLVKNRHLTTGVDVLVFPDVGMSVGSTVWAHGRSAPVQICFWGHPVTTGLPHADYFVSGDAFEPDDGQDRFAEQLVRMDSLSFYFRSPRNATSSRQEISGGGDGDGGFDWTSLGIPDDGIVFLCPQTLPKFHPAFDEVLHRVLDLNEKAYVLVIYDKEKPGWKKT